MKTTFNRLLAIILVSIASIQAAWELAPGSTILTIPTGDDATNVMTFEPLLSMFERYKCPNPESGSESDDSDAATSRP